MPTTPGEQTALVELTAAAFIDCGPNIPVSFQGQNPWTFEGWFKFDGLCPDSSILSKAGEFTFGTSGQQIYAQRTGQIGPVTSDNVLDTVNWFHLAVTFDGTTMTLYVNGIVAGYVNTYDAGVPPQPGNFQIGVGLQGEVDSFRIWNVCVPQNQLFDHMWVDYAPSTQTGLLRQYDFEAVPPTDTSGNNQPPSLVHGAVQVTNTPCVSLFGNAFCDPYDDGAVNPGGGGNDSYTILAWVYVDYLASESCIFSNGPWDGNTGIALCINNGQVMAMRGGSNGTSLMSQTTLNANQWYSIGYTYDGTNQTIFINGVQDSQAAAGSIPTMATGTPLIGGAYNAEGTAIAMPFQGYIQSVAVWSSALSAATIQSWMYNDPTMDTTCVANYWFGTTPVQNMVSGNSVGLVGGAAFLVFQEPISSSASLERPSVPPPPADSTPLHVRMQQAGVSGNPMEGVYPMWPVQPFSPEHKARMLNELLVAAPRSHSRVKRSELIAQFRKKLDDVEDMVKNRPEDLPLRVVKTIEGEDCVLTLHYRREQAEVYRAPEAQTDPCVVWTIQLFTTVIVGFLGVFAVHLNVNAIAQFIGLKIIPENMIMIEIRAMFNAGFTSGGFIRFFSILYNVGLFGPLLQAIVTGMSWWSIFTFSLNIVMLFVPGPTAQKAYFLFQVVDYIGSVILVWQEKPSNC